MIEVKNLTKRYGATIAVNNVSFSAQAGEIVGFIGPNGAGKSTAMRVITCYLPADEGPCVILTSFACPFLQRVLSHRYLELCDQPCSSPVKLVIFKYAKSAQIAY